jgi:hypothetical protein
VDVYGLGGGLVGPLALWMQLLGTCGVASRGGEAGGGRDESGGVVECCRCVGVGIHGPKGAACLWARWCSCWGPANNETAGAQARKAVVGAACQGA